MAKKRERSANFSHHETRILVDLVLKDKNIIENKNIDSIIWKKKEDTWKKLTHEFNCELGTNRSTKMLKCKYEHLKRVIKRKRNTNNCEIYQISEAMPNIVPYTDYEEKLLAVLLTSIDELTPEGDNDTEQNEAKARSIETDEFTPITSLLEEDGDDIALPSRSGSNTDIDAPDEDPVLTKEKDIDYNSRTKRTPQYLKRPISERLNMQNSGQEQFNQNVASLAEQRTVVLDTEQLVVAKELEIKTVELQLKKKDLEKKTRELEIINIQHNWAEEEHKFRINEYEKRLLVLEAHYYSEINQN